MKLKTKKQILKFFYFSYLFLILKIFLKKLATISKQRGIKKTIKIIINDKIINWLVVSSK